ncbi:metalloprotease [Clostridium botulinum]|uniref:metalloprotease n=1 Tax=Clostridium botulinum TaxID=1491 RepID=UPI0006A65C36|nr:hypothetical protein [Clostridium botulinum]
MKIKRKLVVSNKRSNLNIVYNIFMILFTTVVLWGAFNLYYSIGYIFMIFIHELGHYMVAKFLRFKVHFGNVTPWGSYIIHEHTQNCKEEGIIALGGPLAGTICGFIYFIVYYFTNIRTFFLLSFICVVINLINLIPMPPLDGYFILVCINPKICYIGVPFLIYLIITAAKLKDKIFLIFMFIIGTFKITSIVNKYKKKDYFKISKIGC